MKIASLYYQDNIKKKKAEVENKSLFTLYCLHSILRPVEKTLRLRNLVLHMGQKPWIYDVAHV